MHLKKSVNFPCLKFAPKWPISYIQPILVAIFVTIATVKVQLIPDFYTLAIVLMKKVNKQCLLDTPRTVRVSERTCKVIVQTSGPYF